jgi:hypothetical protein
VAVRLTGDTRSRFSWNGNANALWMPPGMQIVDVGEFEERGEPRAHVTA